VVIDGKGGKRFKSNKKRKGPERRKITKKDTGEKKNTRNENSNQITLEGRRRQSEKTRSRKRGEVYKGQKGGVCTEQE